MNQRPRLKVKLTPLDQVLELMGWFSLLAIWISIGTYYQKLPQIIPIHFDGTGQVDGTGDKSSLFWLAGISSILFIGLSILNRFPHIFNYISEITEENALRQYTMATRMLRILKLVLVLLFLVISVMTIKIAGGQMSKLSSWFLPITLVLVFTPIIIYLFKSSKKISD